jgi:hypothetical protein
MKNRKGTAVTVKAAAPFYGFDSLDYKNFRIEDTWKNITGKSWMISDGNLAAMGYGIRSAVGGLPMNDDVWYGKYNGLGYLVHESEIVDEAAPAQDTV